MYRIVSAFFPSFLVLAAFGAGSALAADAPPDYASKVFAQITKNVVYPRLAKMREQEGEVGYLVKIDGGGAVADVSVEASSGNASLDNATLDAVKNAAPFPAPPGGPVDVHGKVAYRLK